MFIYLGIILIVCLIAVLYPYIRYKVRKMVPDKVPKKAHLVWIMHSYVPTVKAGSEITAHALNRYLLTQGYRVSVFVNDYKVSSYEGVDIYRLPKSLHEAPEYALEVFKSADAIGCQNFNGYDGIAYAEELNKPIIFFLHVEFEKLDILQQKFRVPIYVVYNSITQKQALPTIHESCMVRPHIDYAKFKSIKQDNPRFITLLNCNKNKGGEIIVKLAKMLPDYKFLGVQGAYMKQINGQSSNLDYMPLQDDPSSIYAKSKVVIMPSKSESWGRVALEAMSAGVPVIVGDTPGLREATNGGAAICNRTDIDCWMNEIKKLSMDGPEREGMISAGMKRIEELEKATDFSDFDKWFSGHFLNRN
jgi:glycosyltransferase involved in cell wall biosynthesis